MPQITIEHNPSEERLQELGVADWAIWEKEVSQFPIDFDETETAYILEGEILVTPERRRTGAHPAGRPGGFPGRPEQPLGSRQAIAQALQLRLSGLKKGIFGCLFFRLTVNGFPPPRGV